MASPKSNIAITAARKWSSSADVSACFLACNGYPDCKTTRRLVSGTRMARQPDVLLDEKCPLDDAQLLRRQGRFGEFIGCTNYPKCKYTRPITLGIKCPKCNEGEFVRRGIARTRRRPHLLRLQPLSRLRFHHAARADQRAVPEMRRAIHRRKAHQAGKFPHLHQGRLRLGN